MREFVFWVYLLRRPRIALLLLTTIPSITITSSARQRLATRANQPTSDQAESTGGDVGLETATGAYDDPERRPLADADQCAYARALGADKAPALLLIVAGEDKPQLLDVAITADALAFKLRKLAPKK